MIRYTILLLLLLPISAYGGEDPWTTQDPMIRILWQGQHFSDTGTSVETLDAAGGHELYPATTGPLDHETVWGYMLASAILQSLVVSYLPTEIDLFGQPFNPRRPLEVVTINMSGVLDGDSNFFIGLEVKY